MWKLAAAAALLAVALGVVPLSPPSKPDSTPTPVAPSAELQAAVASVRPLLAKYPSAKRKLWVELWTDAAKVATDPKTAAAIPDTPTLRAYQIEMLTIGWVILGEQAPGANPELDAAVNAAFRTVLTDDERAVDATTLAQYADTCRALAWAAR